jgi:hypothetical protein
MSIGPMVVSTAFGRMDPDACTGTIEPIEAKMAAKAVREARRRFTTILS